MWSRLTHPDFKWRKVAAFVLLLTFLPMLSSADYAQFYFENDALDPIDGSDRGYTDGWRISYGYGENHTVFLGQNMYTAHDITIPLSEPPVGDRRYSAWLYGGYGTWRQPDSLKGGKMYFELSMGVTGPSALGESTQKAVHEIINSPEPLGWDSQADSDTLAVQGYIKHQWTLQAGDSKAADLYLATAAGNILVAPEIGLIGRLGRGVSSSLPFDPIVVKASNTLALYVYMGGVLRYVVYDGLLEDSDVNIRNTVIDAVFGAVWETKLGLDISYQWTQRTRQFSEQLEAAKFGAIGVRYTY